MASRRTVSEEAIDEALNQLHKATKSYENMTRAVCKYRSTVTELVLELENCQKRAEEIIATKFVPSVEVGQRSNPYIMNVKKELRE